MINAVLFDLFETLITESPVRPRRASSLGESLGLERDAFRAEWKNRRPRVMLGRLSFAEALADICRTLTGTVDVGAVQRLCDQRALEKAAAFAHSSDEVAALVTDLADHHVALGVISNCFEEDVRAWSAWPLARKFRCAMFSFAAGVAKPEAEIYRRAVRELGVQPSTTLFVGDGGDDELVGAEQAGLRAYRATWFNADRRHGRPESGTPDLASCHDVLRIVGAG
jgi:putative hydrolase of the HAD superfamily